MNIMSRLKSIKISKITILTLGANLAFQGPTQGKFDGFYAGASLGYMQQNTTLDAKQNPENPNADIYHSTAGHGLPMAELFLGWGKVFGGSIYGGIEGKVDLLMGGNKKVAEDISFIYLSNRKGPGIGLLTRLGYLVTSQTMIYGGIGIMTVKFQHNLYEKEGQISAPFSKRSLRLLTEVGVETFSNFIQNLTFRFSYSFVPKRDIIRKAANFPENHMYGENGIFKTSVAEHAIKAGVVYRF